MSINDAHLNTSIERIVAALNELMLTIRDFDVIVKRYPKESAQHMNEIIGCGNELLRIAGRVQKFLHEKGK